jgi:hypothetical protein
VAVDEELCWGNIKLFADIFADKGEDRAAGLPVARLVSSTKLMAMFDAWQVRRECLPSCALAWNPHGVILCSVSV